MPKKRPSNRPIRKAIGKAIGKKLPKNIQVDHKKPLKDGGKHTLRNIQLLPKKLHQKKTALENKRRALRKHR